MNTQLSTSHKADESLRASSTVPVGLPRLHLGSFDCPRDGWINTDVTPHIWVSRIPLAAFSLFKLGKMTAARYAEHKRGIFRKLRYLDVTKTFPFKDNSLSAIFSCHMLEHLFPWQAEICLKESYRVLAPGGVCRIVVPDLDKLIGSFRSEDPTPFLDAFFEQSPARSKNAHHWQYNESNLREKLTSIGFTEVYRCKYQKGRCPDVEQLDNRPQSLFVEGIK